MAFNSVQYAALLAGVLAVYWRLGHRAQNVLLLVTSYFFYATFDWRFLGLMWISTMTDFTVGRVLARTEDDRKRKRAFVVSLVVNLGILGLFKYFNFFIDGAERVLSSVGLNPGTPVLSVLLPVGISFYTFHGISYAFDVYRRHIEPTRDLLSFAVFVAFFPQLVAGPIGRAHIQLPQIEHPRQRPTAREAVSGLWLILLGLFKKVAIADALAPFVNDAFNTSRTAGWVTLVIGMYGFALQIYGDFSGYSDIARGSARLLGVELPVNFDHPYFSHNITEFWRRWHISLSNWLRDYLYVPLGGNRGSRVATYRNLLITMVLGGLWHGAAFTFLAWGAIHGLLLAGHRWYTERRPAGAAIIRTPLRSAAQRFATFTVVAAVFILFRAETFGAAVTYVTRIVTLRPGAVSGDALAMLLLAAVALLLIDVPQYLKQDHSDMIDWEPLRRGALVGSMVLAIVVFSGAPPVPFIYFQF